MAEDGRHAQLAHQGGGELLEGVAEDDHLGESAQVVEEVLGSLHRDKTADHIGDQAHRQAVVVEEGQAPLHQHVVVRLVARCAAQLGDTGAFGHRDPDLRHQHPFEVEGDDGLLGNCGLVHGGLFFPTMTISTMSSTMMDDYQLTLLPLFRHGRQLHAQSRIITFTGGDGDSAYVESTFTEVADRADRLASALARLGIQPGDRVGTFLWNNQTHMEAYLAIPCMGAVLHTLNIRLFPEQLSYVINHGEDRVIIVDASIAPLLARVRHELTTVEHIIVKGPGDASSLGDDVLDYDQLLAAEPGGYEYPEVSENTGAAMCYTSGTTGNPKGVMYSHRSTYMHSMMVTSTANIALAETDRMLVIVPMFHANAWGTPYAAWMIGADLVFPQQHLQAAPLARIIDRHPPHPHRSSADRAQ